MNQSTTTLIVADEDLLLRSSIRAFSCAAGSSRSATWAGSRIV